MIFFCCCFWKVKYEELFESSRSWWKNTLCSYIILTDISFKIVTLSTYTPIPSGFPLLESIPETILSEAVKDRRHFLLNVEYVCKRSSFQFQFQFWKWCESKGSYIRWMGGWGITTMLLRAKNGVVFRDCFSGPLEQTLRQSWANL